jgi:hypothetical protein
MVGKECGSLAVRVTVEEKSRQDSALKLQSRINFCETSSSRLEQNKLLSMPTSIQVGHD